MMNQKTPFHMSVHLKKNKNQIHEIVIFITRASGTLCRPETLFAARTEGEGKRGNEGKLRFPPSVMKKQIFFYY